MSFWFLTNEIFDELKGQRFYEKYERKRRLRTKKVLFKKRKAIAEAPFSWLKAGLGFRRFSLRSLVKVVGESFLALIMRRLSTRMVWKTA